ncbi:hypothetical protein SAMN05720354_10566 [Nitrosospira sp. Nsp1]|nr:hypothetical protein SAMN05720354_10566 [Nitrosospira sp. Nsp1]
MNLLFADKARREVMACFFLCTEIAYRSFKLSRFPDVIYSAGNIMYFVTSSLTRSPIQAGNDIFTKLLTYRINNHE